MKWVMTEPLVKREQECPNCKEHYIALGKHWISCGYPNLSEEQKEIMIGCLMGDATIDHRDRNNPRFTLSNTNLNYAKYVFEKLQPFATFNKASMTNSNIKQVYTVRVTHPYCKELSKWYNSGRKRFPDINLTPTILKNWYCCDGCKQLTDNGARVNIASKNESDRPEFVEQLFKNIGFDVTFSRYSLFANHYESVDIWNYMGDPLPGMEYKWN